MSGSQHDITRMLADVDEGREGAMDDLMDAVFADLNEIAERHMARQFGRGLPGVTLEPGALVNESFLKLIQQRNRFANREQFFAIATRIMLRVLGDYQRSRRAQKRGGGWNRITLSVCESPSDQPTRGTTMQVALDALTAALDKLDEMDRRKADVIRLRVVWGLTMKQAAEALDISLATAERDWAFAKAWLAREAAETEGEGGVRGG